MRLIHLIVVFATYPSSGFSEEAPEIRYRGDYTFGHEVNSFCPEISSQCFWVGGRTGEATQNSLRALYRERTSRPYQSVCLVVAGSIDRESPRKGFAIDFDGVLSINKLFGVCAESDVVTQADLQHHRWVLTALDGEPLASAALDYVIPELDFGERMHVAGNTGCNYFTGTARLDAEFLSVEQMVTTTKHCTPAQSDLELVVSSVVAGKPRIFLRSGNELVLESGSTELTYSLKDWVH